MCVLLLTERGDDDARTLERKMKKMQTWIRACAHFSGKINWGLSG